MALQRISDLTPGTPPYSNASLLEVSVPTGTSPPYASYNVTLAEITANQTITLSGDITGSGTTAITTTLSDPVVAETFRASGAAAQLRLEDRNNAATGFIAYADSTYRIHSISQAADRLTLSATGNLTLTGTATLGSPLTIANGGTGATTAPTALANLGGISGNQTITLSGDVGGSGTTAIAVTVTQLQGRPVSATAPDTDQVLQWNGSAWTPATVAGGGGATSITAGTGITVTPNPLTGTGTVGLTVPVAVTSGGTGAITAPAALTSLGAVPLAGGTMTGKLITPTATTASAGLNLGVGAANPTSPVSGDLWIAGSALFVRTGSTTRGLAPTQDPVFTGAPQMPTGAFGVTQALTDSSTKLATTAFVKGNVPVPMTVALGGTGATTLTNDAVLVGSVTAAVRSSGALVDTSGNFSAPGSVQSGTAGVASPNAAFSFVERDTTGNWLWYATGGAANLFYAANKFSVSTASGAIVGTPTGSFKGAGTLNATAVYANNVVLTSDVALKRDVGDLPACLPLVAAIAPKAYRWAVPDPLPQRALSDECLTVEELGPPGHFEARHYGFLAQDVGRVMGAIAHERGPDGTEAVSVGDLLATLWQAVRELSEEVATLKAKAG